MSEFMKCLIQGRKRKHLTQRDAAEMAGISKENLIRLESGSFVDLNENELRRIASVVGADGDMMISLFRTEFRPELRAAEKRPGPASSSPASAPLSKELADIEKILMTMPAESKENLITMFHLLVQAQMLAQAHAFRFKTA